MLTTEQTDRFIEMAEDYVGLDPADVVATRDTVEDFIAAQGQPEILPECSLPGDSRDGQTLYVWERRTTHSPIILVADFGEFRAAYTDAIASLPQQASS
jgi:hypothetical protein